MQLKDIKLTSFSVPKILWLHLEPVCSKSHLHRTLPNNPHLENKHFTAYLDLLQNHLFFKCQ